MANRHAERQLEHFVSGTRVEVVRLASGLKMRWFERGEGTPVIMLHGFPELAVSWRFALADLSDRFRVIVPDMRGYGGTDAPADVEDYSTDALVRDVLELADAAGVRDFHLVGHDWGAAVAWQVGMRHAIRLRSLAACNCPPAQLMFRDITNLEQVRRSWYIFFFQLPWIPEATLLRDPEAAVQRVFRASAVDPTNFTDDALAPYVAQFRDRGLPGLNYYRAAMRHPLVRLDRIDCPVRLIWGLGDPALGPQFADAERYRPFCPRFEVTTIDAHTAGHWVQQEAPELVNRALREHFDAADGRA